MMDLTTFGKAPCQIMLAKILPRRRRYVQKKVGRFIKLWDRYFGRVADCEGMSLDEKQFVLDLLYDRARHSLPQALSDDNEVRNFVVSTLRVFYRNSVQDAAKRSVEASGKPNKLVIVESPYAGDVEGNVIYARAALKDCLMRGEARPRSHPTFSTHRKAFSTMGFRMNAVWVSKQDWRGAKRLRRPSSTSIAGGAKA